MQRTDRAAYDTLQEHNSDIVKSNLNPLSIADDLFSKTIIGEDVQEQVSALSTKQDRLRLLLQAVRGSGREGVFQEFVKSILAVSAADWLGKKLIETYRSKGGKWMDEPPPSGQPPAGSRVPYHPQMRVPKPESKDLHRLPIKDWYALGLELHLRDFDLEVIKNDGGGMQVCIRKMFQAWLTQQPDASYQQLVNALCKIKENSVASDLCKTYPGLRMPTTQRESGPEQPQHEYQHHTTTPPPGQGQPPPHGYYIQGQPAGQSYPPHGQPGPQPQGYYIQGQPAGQSYPPHGQPGPQPQGYYIQGQPAGQSYPPQPGPPPQGYYIQGQSVGQSYPPQPGLPPHGYYYQGQPTGQFSSPYGQPGNWYPPPTSQPHSQFPPPNQPFLHQGQTHSGGVVPGATLTALPRANGVPAVHPQANGQPPQSGGGDHDSTSAASGNTAIYRHERPTLRQLKKFPGRRKAINIAEHIAICNDFGTYLLKDDEGLKVPRIKQANHYDPALVADKILSEWIAGRGVMPITWETLLECLRDAELNTLAHDIEEVVQ